MKFILILLFLLSANMLFAQEVSNNKVTTNSKNKAVQSKDEAVQSKDEAVPHPTKAVPPVSHPKTKNVVTKTAKKEAAKSIAKSVGKEIKETIAENFKRTCAINYAKPYTLDTALIVGTPNGFDFRFWLPFNISMESIIGVDFNKNFLASLGVNHKYRPYQNSVISFDIDYGTKFILGTQLDDDGRSLKISIGFPLGFTIPIRNSAISFSTYFAPGFTIKPILNWDYSWGITFIYNFEVAKRERASRKCLSGKLGQLGGKYDELGGKYNELDGKYGNLQEENEGLSLKNKALEAEKASLAFEKKKLENDKEKLESENKGLEENLNNMESEKKKIEEQIKNTSSSEETEELKKQLEELKKQKEQAEKEKERLQKEKENLNQDIEKNNKRTCELSGGTFSNGKCICSAGKVSRNNRCVCAGVNQSWSNKYKKCTCLKGYSSKKSGTCQKCRLISYWGNCLNKCPRPQVEWKGRCVCPSSKGYRRAGNGSCVCKSGYKDYGDGVCIPAGN